MATAGSSLSATPSSRRSGAGKESEIEEEIHSDGGETDGARVGVKRKIKKRVDEKGRGKMDVNKSANITSHTTAYLVYLVSTRLVSTHGTTELRDQYI